tara:strand:+ start:113 stop:391 length:279 start_codon:yes stop_codon:yes gene_type:complete
MIKAEIVTVNLVGMEEDRLEAFSASLGVSMTKESLEGAEGKKTSVSVSKSLSELAEDIACAFECYSKDQEIKQSVQKAKREARSKREELTYK